jgi:hypothetical protein
MKSFAVTTALTLLASTSFSFLPIPKASAAINPLPLVEPLTTPTTIPQLSKSNIAEVLPSQEIKVSYSHCYYRYYYDAYGNYIYEYLCF